LLVSFPNAGEIDREAYMRVLMEDVADIQPSIGDLEAACRNLRRTLKFIPAISEMMAALDLAKGSRLSIAFQISSIAERDHDKAHEQYREYQNSKQQGKWHNV
jgi:hypothetical protein